MNKTAIVIPIWKDSMTKFEEISFRQCCFVLKKNVIFLVTYKNIHLDKYISVLDSNNNTYKIIVLNESNFLSISSYNNLLLSFFFYLRFFLFQYILIYQLDCFVFRDELDLWTQDGYSYIGAPWLQGYNEAVYGAHVIGVGNGGFSLRRVKDHLRVLASLHSRLFLNKFAENEDIFWCEFAARKFSWFTVPDWRVAAKFSIEVHPRYFFEKNNHQISFGCHAWWKYDIDFWKPYIEKFGYNLS